VKPSIPPIRDESIQPFENINRKTPFPINLVAFNEMRERPPHIFPIFRRKPGRLAWVGFLNAWWTRTFLIVGHPPLGEAFFHHVSIFKILSVFVA
jgi:hypothetical protein